MIGFAVGDSGGVMLVEVVEGGVLDEEEFIVPEVEGRVVAIGFVAGALGKVLGDKVAGVLLPLPVAGGFVSGTCDEDLGEGSGDWFGETALGLATNEEY